MTEPGRLQGDAAEALRREFDASFALPSTGGGEETDSFLALTVGADPYAIAVREIAGLTAARKIVSLASSMAALLGLAGVRGDVLPVYSLAALMGYAREEKAPRWFVLGKGLGRVAFAFGELEGQIAFPRSDLLAHDGGSGRKHVRAVLRTAKALRGVIDMTSLEETVAEAASAAGTITIKE